MNTKKIISKNISSYTKSLHTTLIGVALFSVLNSCENTQGAGSTKPITEDKIELHTYNDADIDIFEKSLPYAQQWEQPIYTTIEDSAWIEQQFSIHTLRSNALDEKPVMDTVEYIALHSTEHLPGQKENNVIMFLQKTGKIHFIVKRDGSLTQFLPTTSNNLVQIDHLGKQSNEISHASWNHDPNITLKTIGIEVCAYPGQTRSDAQYITIKKLLGYIGKKYNLVQKDIVTHTMVAYSSEYGMMRKQDPYGISWEKLGVAPASAQINRDVVSGDIAPNLTSFYEWLRSNKNGKHAMNHQQAISYLRSHYSGLDNSIALHKQRNNFCINPRAQRANNIKARMSIEEINQNMKDYTPPRKIYHKKKGAYKAHHRRR